MAPLTADVLVIGSGVAGLAAAVSARQAGSDVIVVSKGPPARGCSSAVAGGILNAALGLADPADGPEGHFLDTVEAGRFLNEEPQVAAMAEGIVREIPRLEACGVRFVKEDGHLLQVRSAGHRRPRTLLFQNRHGTDLADPILATARGLGVRFMGGLGTVDLLMRDGVAAGALFLDPRTGETTVVAAGTVVLATGGAGLFYQATGIPPLTPGDGYALARRAGCSLVDLEFVQFYPTALVGENFPRRLVPYDYLLAKGAAFRNARGEDLVSTHGLPEPAMITRSQLAGAIGREINAGNGVDGAVLMDLSRFQPGPEDLAFLRHPFSDFFMRNMAEGRDLRAQPLRVAPIVHHFMGGVKVDAAGRSEVPGLLVCGEAAGSTHGANRLAGNAFTEAVSSGFRAGELAATLAAGPPPEDLEATTRALADRVRDRLARRSRTKVNHVVASFRRVLSRGAGACRDRVGLEAAALELASLAAEAEEAEAGDVAERGIASTLAGLVQVARLMVESCLLREESRGAHVRADFTAEHDRFLHHIVHPSSGGVQRISVARRDPPGDTPPTGRDAY